MTTWWLVAAPLVGAAILVGWPARRIRARRRAVISGRQPGSLARRPAWGSRPAGSSPAGVTPGSGTGDSTGGTAPPSWPIALDRLLVSVPPWQAVVVGVMLGGVGGALLGGPVAALAVAAYAGVAVRGLLRRRSDRLAGRARRRRLDELCGLAADLRAGLPPSTVLLAADGSDRLAGLARAAVRLAEQTGAPLADLLERIEADARAMDRGLAAAEAQAAGARATAWLLAALPAGGIALGYGIGVDPLAILLDTPIGAACAIGAVALQLAGLAWASRLGDAGRTARLDGDGDAGRTARLDGDGDVDRIDALAGSAGNVDRSGGSAGGAGRFGSRPGGIGVTVRGGGRLPRRATEVDGLGGTTGGSAGYAGRVPEVDASGAGALAAGRYARLTVAGR